MWYTNTDITRKIIIYNTVPNYKIKFRIMKASLRGIQYIYVYICD